MQSAPVEFESQRTACRHCQHVNPLGKRFCAGCGKPLWEQCPRCNAECLISERFCGACGTDISELVEQQNETYRSQLEQALDLAAKHHYDDSMAILGSLARISEDRYQRWAKQAQEEIERVEGQRSSELAAAEDALRKAGDLLKDHLYENAHSALKTVPEPLRTQEHKRALEKAVAYQSELRALADEVRDALAKKELANLLPKLVRLLELKPSHEQARQLAQRLCDNLLTSAKSRLGKHDYQGALDRLNEIPFTMRGDECEALREKADELQSLLVEVKSGALAERQLLALADRLCKSAPANTAAAQLRAELAKKVQVKPSDPRLAAPDWSSPPKKTLLGVPLDSLAYLVRPAAATDSVSETLRSHPGQFFTAFGHALQGLGIGTIVPDLMPTEKGTGLLGAIPTLKFGQRPASAAWGVDLSTHALKAIKLVRQEKDAVKIVAAEYIRCECSAGRNDDVARAEARDATLRGFVSRAGDTKGVRICIGIPGQRVLARYTSLPPMPAKKTPELLQYEARHQFPIPLEHLCWTYAILNEPAGKSDIDQERQVLIQAARETHVRDRIGVFKAAGLSVDCVQSDCVALHNAMLHEFFGQGTASTPEHAIALIDVGAENTSIVIGSPKSIWFRTVGQSGDSFTQELARRLSLDFDQADLIRRNPAKAPRFAQWQEALHPLFEQLHGEIDRSILSYHKLHGGTPLRHVYGVGGAFQTLGLLRHLRTGSPRQSFGSD
jgi:type IV pilus assembly protein PilM